MDTEQNEDNQLIQNQETKIKDIPQNPTSKSNKVVPITNDMQKQISNDCNTISNTGSFEIGIEELTEYVNTLQQRVFCEEIDQLEKKGEQNLLTQLKTDPKKGISEKDIEERKMVFGTNEKDPTPLKTLWEIFLSAMDDMTLKILVVASIVSIIVEMLTADESHRSTAWIEGFAIMVAVGISSGITTINDYEKQKQFAHLSQLTEGRKMINLIRDGNNLYLHQSCLLVGDIVIIQNGSEIPADGILLQASEMTADESAMTGETLPIKKDTLSQCIKQRETIIKENQEKDAHGVASPIMLSGSTVLSGEGKMVVIAVGKFSAIGKIQNLLSSQEQQATPLQKKLEKIAEDIGIFGLVSALIILTVLIIRFIIEESAKENGFGKSYTGKYIVDYVLIAITVIVVAIPEGLPLAVTLSLAFSVKKMLLDQNLVRQMSACETMGGANCICSDKTGTLTQNKMNLNKMWNQKQIEIDTYSENIKLQDYFPESLLELAKLSFCINNNATLDPEESGTATDIALLKFMKRGGVNITKLRDQCQVDRVIPFSSSRKRMSAILKHEGQNMILVKGASEIVLESCSQIHQFDGSLKSIDTQMKTDIEEAITNMASQALRTIAIAYRKVNDGEDMETKDDKGVFNCEQKDLILIGILGIKDILRQEVPGAIQLCKKAGVRVRMVTGDNLITARAIAMECGIIEPDNYDSLVMNGLDFINLVGGIVCKNCKIKVCDCPLNELDAEKQKKKVRVDTVANALEFDKIINKLDVLSRSRPEDKYCLVVGLIERGNVVAVTGDGTNDAPALKRADVGFAMGIAGTQVAREASDIILLDDNFNSIIKAIMWGRNIYDSIQKFLQFQLTVNLCAVIITLVGAMVVKSQILTPLQMLWINLIMDTLASLALATEPPTQALLERKPHSRDEYIITRKMAKHIIGQALYQLTILFIIVFTGETWIPEYVDDLDGRIAAYMAKGTTFVDNTGKTQPINYYSKYSNAEKNLVRSGRPFMMDSSDEDYFMKLKTEIGPSRHYTFVFNTFVMLQIFNFINARKLKDEWNVFGGISKSTYFNVIIVAILFLQAVLLTHGSIALNCYNNIDPKTGGGGLQIQQWLISLALGSASLIVNLFLKIIREDEICIQRGNEEKDPLKDRGVLNIKKGSKNIKENIKF